MPETRTDRSTAKEILRTRSYKLYFPQSPNPTWSCARPTTAAPVRHAKANQQIQIVSSLLHFTPPHEKCISRSQRLRNTSNKALDTYSIFPVLSKHAKRD